MSNSVQPHRRQPTKAPPSLGFSRQEHWSGLPFSFPMNESEKWKWSHSVVSDSLWPHGLQPTRLLRLWDCPGKSTGVGCPCLLQCMKVKRESEVTQSCLTLRDPMDCSLPGSSVHGIFQVRALLLTLLINCAYIREFLHSLSFQCPATSFSPCRYMTDGYFVWSGSENLRE